MAGRISSIHTWQAMYDTYILYIYVSCDAVTDLNLRLCTTNIGRGWCVYCPANNSRFYVLGNRSTSKWLNVYSTNGITNLQLNFSYDGSINLKAIFMQNASRWKSVFPVAMLSSSIHVCWVMLTTPPMMMIFVALCPAGKCILFIFEANPQRKPSR